MCVCVCHGPRRSWLAKLALLHTSPDACAIYPPVVHNGNDEFAPHTSQAAGPAGPAYPSVPLDFIASLFDAYMEPLLSKLKQQCKTVLPSVDINMVTSTCHLITVSVSCCGVRVCVCVSACVTTCLQNHAHA